MYCPTGSSHSGNVKALTDNGCRVGAGSNRSAGMQGAWFDGASGVKDNVTATMPDEHKPPSAIQPLWYRGFALLFLGQTISSLGNLAYTTVLTWTIYSISGSTVATGLVVLASSVPRILLLLFGGVAGDRMSRRAIILVSDVLSGTAIGAVALLALTGNLTIPALATLSIVTGAVSAFFLPSYTALTPEIVPEEALQRANGLQGMSQGATQVIGPLIGATLYAWGRAGAAFGFDALTFLFSALATVCIRVAPRPRPPRQPLLLDVRSGWSYVRRTPWVWQTIALASLAVATAIAPLTILLPAVLRHLRLPVTYMGMTMAIAGAAGILANVLLTRWPVHHHRGVVMSLCFALSGTGTLVIGLSQSYVSIAAGAILFGFGFAGTTIWQALLQELVPREYLSRVTSLDFLGSLGLMPVGYALSGFLAAIFPAQDVLAAGGLIAAGLFVAAAFSPAIRRVDEGRMQSG